MYRTLVEAVLHHGETKPEKLAVAFKNVCLDYRTLCLSIPWLQSHSIRYREPSIPNDRAT